MKKERSITINVINNNKTNTNKLAKYFAKKYMDKYTNKKS